jgi:dihydrofolate reductase/uncharacterized protein YndB with AHSA1/START domain
MRPLINSTFVSLDGVVNHMDKWHFSYIDDESDQLTYDQLASCDAMLMGRKTYEAYAAVWPTRDGAYPDLINAIPKHVVSTTLESPSWQNTTVLNGDVVRSVQALKEAPGRGILMHGFGPLAKTLLGEGLLDELHLWFHPAFAGVGDPDDQLLTAGLNVYVQHRATRTLGSGVVMVSYDCLREREPEVANLNWDTSTGFTLSRVLPGTPAEVFAHFTEPALFSRWFVVEGFTTPASRISLDPKPDGTISAVMVPDQGGPDIPFTARYGIVEPSRRVQFEFSDPTEMVTISLLDLAQEGTQLTYANVGAALSGRAEALSGVERMLDALESSVADSRQP